MIKGIAFIRFCRPAMLGAILVGCAGRTLAPPSDLPPALRAPADQTLSLVLHGGGVQVYECRAAADNAAHYSWVLRGPEADLTNQAGETVGRHFAGPTWAAEDGSSVTAEVVAQDNSGGADALPWLLLRASSNAGKGVFAKVRSIQRLHTIGGKAPANSCDASQARKPIRVPYSADYYFYTARR